ncbi:MAG: bis(5'-nucleosyl)-tetraphosphatase (symmetrical) YqeK [Clostridiales bacterium]|nr:bis(5'-nucleosyl)-tetraphosphatase (symmetrical) YqeK [Clostridiales bacterium]MCF8022987.1 bis(5'-nucleosyl)-tetraphosphatase (symmetrical) YqeK [Clostridiales bacterium]
MQEKEILEKLASLITPKRLKHSLRTRDTAVELAAKYGFDRGRVSLAALLHDCARDFSEERLLEIARQEGIKIGDMEEKAPILLHGPVGAVIASKSFGIHDTQILKAISAHTTGAEVFEMLDKIIYISDKIERGRDFPGVEELREKAFTDLNEGALACLDNSIKFSLNKKMLLHPYLCCARNSVLLDIIQNS